MPSARALLALIIALSSPALAGAAEAGTAQPAFERVRALASDAAGHVRWLGAPTVEIAE